METKTDVGFLLAGTPSYKDLQKCISKMVQSRWNCRRN